MATKKSTKRQIKGTVNLQTGIYAPILPEEYNFVREVIQPEDVMFIRAGAPDHTNHPYSQVKGMVKARILKKYPNFALTTIGCMLYPDIVMGYRYTLKHEAELQAAPFARRTYDSGKGAPTFAEARDHDYRK